MDEELETKIGAVMCVHMDANAALSRMRHNTGPFLGGQKAKF